MPSLDRRTTLRAAGWAGLAATSAVATGCTVHGDEPGRATPTRAPLTAETRRDVALAAALVGDVAATVALAERTLGAHPTLAPRLRPLLRTQRTHLRVLRRATDVGSGAVATASPTATPVPVDPKRALAVVVGHARANRTALAGAAARAASGRFALLLASMGAALAQRVAVIGRSGS